MKTQIPHTDKRRNRGQTARNGRGIAGILFDLDNTLIATEAIAANALATVLLKYDVVLEPDEEEWMVGRRWDDIFDRLFSPRNLPLSREELAHLVLAEKDEQLLHLRNEGKLPVLPGAIEALQSLHPRYPLGIVSGSFRDEIDSVLALMGISHLFRCIVGSEDVSHGKPHPEPYLNGSRLLDLQPQHILVFEDSPPGVTAALEAGCICIAVLAGGSSADSLRHAHLVIPTLERVTPEFVETLHHRVG